MLTKRVELPTKTNRGSPRIDVVMPTKNSAKTLRRCLNAVYREIPLCHLIVVDANSNDGTVEILKEFPNVDLLRGPWHLGKAREIGIKRVHTDFFAFVDSDVEIGANCFRAMRVCMHALEVGAVEGTGRGGNWFRVSERVSKLLGLPQERPYTGNTLVRTSVVKDIGLPDLVLYEDYLIRKYVEARGFRWVKTERGFTAQLSTLFERDPKREILAGEYAWQYAWQFERRGNGYFPPFLLLLKIIYAFASAHVYSREKAVKAGIHQSLVHLYYTCGFLKACLAKS